MSWLVAQTRTKQGKSNRDTDSGAPCKQRKVDVQPDSSIPSATEEEWRDFESDFNTFTFEAQHIHGKAKLAFAFVKGPLVPAIRDGHW